MSETAFRVCTAGEGVVIVEADTVLFRNGGIRLLSNGHMRAEFKSFVYFTAPGANGVRVLEDPVLFPPPTVEPARMVAFGPSLLCRVMPYVWGVVLGVVLSGFVRALSA
jgi:hypothetical protein